MIASQSLRITNTRSQLSVAAGLSQRKQAWGHSWALVKWSDHPDCRSTLHGIKPLLWTPATIPGSRVSIRWLPSLVGRGVDETLRCACWSRLPPVHSTDVLLASTAMYKADGCGTQLWSATAGTAHEQTQQRLNTALPSQVCQLCEHVCLRQESLVAKGSGDRSPHSRRKSDIPSVTQIRFEVPSMCMNAN